MQYNFSPFKIRSAEILDWLHKEFASIRTGRASPALLDGVQVIMYEARTPLSHVASISIEDPKTLRIAPWDKTAVKAIESALQASNLGLSIATDAAGVRVGFPELTSETRKVLAKAAKEKCEEAKVSLRQEREKVLGDITAKEKAGDMSEDEKFRFRDELQKLVDATSRDLEALFAKKEKEITEG